MAHFSLQDISSEEAEEFGMVDAELLLRYFEAAEARVVLLTDLDLAELDEAGIREQVEDALAEHYQSMSEDRQWGPSGGVLHVYIRRNPTNGSE